MIGGEIDEATRSILHAILQPSVAAQAVRSLRKKLWPNGQWYYMNKEQAQGSSNGWNPSLSPEVLEAESVEVMKIFSSSNDGSGGLVSLVGKRAFGRGMFTLKSAVQSELFCKQVVLGH